MHLIIDNKEIEAQDGMTILQAAQANGIEIPTLCAHKDLTPYGACRLCIVEIEGFRGFNTACTTPAMEGMVVRTNSGEIQNERYQTIQLILSKHPSGCLICDQHDDCTNCMETLRKVGLTTGCRTCPKDGHCELQDVVKKMGITELIYPVNYRSLPVERYDPFFDRDYNLCILCGRCVQVCNEVRFADVLSFIKRGHKTIVGTAYGRSHMDSGCEFCGACVSVCPTGALYEKANKWDGVPDSEVVTTCPYCGVGCQIRLLVKNGEVIGSLPVEDHLVSNSQLCVKGRFSVTEMVTNPFRLTKPAKVVEGMKKDIEWDEAVALAAEKLAGCPPEEFGMLVSPNCTTEDLFVAQKFCRVVMASNNVDTSARTFYGNSFYPYLDLLRRSVPLSALQDAGLILSIGLDTRFDRSVIGVKIHKAVNAGAILLSVHSKAGKLDLISSCHLQPKRGSEIELFQYLEQHTSKGFDVGGVIDDGYGGCLKSFAERMRKAKSCVILVGSEYLHDDDGAAVLNSILHIAENVNAGIIALPVHNNLTGSLWMGTYPEYLPGGRLVSLDEYRQKFQNAWGCLLSHEKTVWNAASISAGKKLNVLYLVGEVPGRARPEANTLIYQNIYPPPHDYCPELVLPSAAFSEVDGTFINQDGRIQPVHKAVQPPAAAQPDWQILCQVAKKMGVKGFDYECAGDILEELCDLIPELNGIDPAGREVNRIDIKTPGGEVPKIHSESKEVSQDYPWMLSSSCIEHTYYGYPMTDRVAGLREIYAEGTVVLHPEDAARVGVGSGDEIIITAVTGEEIVMPLQINDGYDAGILHITFAPWEKRLPNPVPVNIRKKDV